MSDSEYVKIYTGNYIIVQLIKDRLEQVGISPVIKDESESGRLAGFAAALQGQPEVYVHEKELGEAVKIVETVRGEMENK
ncbi:DUF2007 domain-containing protein [Bizionia paragorgiae]|uniref:Putative signal transducing protein n=1 Tax=Bizionia paragorgiae TaxID=283786 RepID=A0A1H3XG86_BIZPA|nr:DUF2007 domain-containing protein [Bizionia paragorgiae]MDX1271665.1 DUF2007 domain-containing protein [Bizionia paragorgiae]SDZ98230.1 Putative signal transducing protein [Bizionia paragorgiae]